MRFRSSTLVALLRLVLTGLIVFTVAWQFRISQSRQGDAFNFFSYFTILSNLFLASVLVVAAASALRKNRVPLILESARGAVTVYMIATGIVYALLLSRIDVHITEPWVNHVLHQLMPVVAALDWLLIPSSRRLSHSAWWSWMLFPLVYLVYSLIRGLIVGWYPYPFLDPGSPDGYVRVVVYSVGLAVFMALLVMGVGWVGNRRVHRR